MYNLLIFIVVALIGILLYLMITKRKLQQFIIVILLIIIGAVLLMGFRFTASSALPFAVNVIESVNTNYGKAILYEDRKNNTFGLAEVNRSLGVLYHYSGGTSDYFIEGDEPFQAAGYGSDKEDGFMVGVRTNDPKIKYIVVGNHLEKLTLSDTYNFNMETVEKYPDIYNIEEVVANYVLFVLDGYSEEAWTIRALDKDGNLIADKLFGTGEARYIDW